MRLLPVLALFALPALAAAQPLLPVVQSVTTYYPDGRVVTVHTLADGRKVGVEDTTAPRAQLKVAAPAPVKAAPLCRVCGNNCDCFNGCACDEKSWDAACAAAPKPGTIVAASPPPPAVIPPTTYYAPPTYQPVYPQSVYTQPTYYYPPATYYTPQTQPVPMPTYRPSFGVGFNARGPFGGSVGAGVCLPGGK